MIPSSLPKRWRDVPSRVYCDGGLFKSSSLFSASLRRFLISSKSASKHFTPQQFQGLVATIQRKLHDKVPDRLGQLGNDPGWPYKNEAVLNPDYARVDPEVQITQNDQLQNERLRLKKKVSFWLPKPSWKILRIQELWSPCVDPVLSGIQHPSLLPLLLPSIDPTNRIWKLIKSQET